MATNLYPQCGSIECADRDLGHRLFRGPEKLEGLGVDLAKIYPFFFCLDIFRKLMFSLRFLLVHRFFLLRMFVHGSSQSQVCFRSLVAGVVSAIIYFIASYHHVRFVV